MKLISVQEASIKLFKRQNSTKGLKFKVGGLVAYVGENLPPSTYHYYSNDNFIKHIPLDSTLQLPSSCPFACVYCPHTVKHGLDTSLKPHGVIPEVLKDYLLNDALGSFESTDTPAILYGGATDPTIYTSTLVDLLQFYNEEVQLPKEIWHHAYTSGMYISETDIKRLADNGLNELIFHAGASNFDEQMYESIAIARKYIEVITVETPAWQLHKQKLFDMLPKLEELKVDHLSLTAIDINNNNKAAISNAYPQAQVYNLYNVVLEDEGLTYDLIEEVLNRGYSYSVLDLNNFVVLYSQGEAKKCT